MAAYIIKRIFHGLLVLVGVSIVVFILLYIGPGDPARMLASEVATEENIQQFRIRFGLDQPLHIQYLRFIKDIFEGNMGVSYFFRQPVTKVIRERIGATVELAIAASFVTIFLAIPLGILSATHRKTLLDLFANIIALFGLSTPIFWVGIMFILIFSVSLDWLPVFGRGEPILNTFLLIFENGDFMPLIDSIKHLILPSLTLGSYYTARVMRLTRNQMLEILNEAYIQTAKAKGLPRWIVLYKHTLRNALIPIVTVLGLQFGTLLGGAVISEAVFAWPGLGRLFIQAISHWDFPLIRVEILLISFTFVTINLCVDILYSFINPRIKYD
ncbi:MAG: ABC transporter permease [bacterium]